MTLLVLARSFICFPSTHWLLSVFNACINTQLHFAAVRVFDFVSTAGGVHPHSRVSYFGPAVHHESCHLRAVGEKHSACMMLVGTSACCSPINVRFAQVLKAIQAPLGLSVPLTLQH